MENSTRKPHYEYTTMRVSGSSDTDMAAMLRDGWEYLGLKRSRAGGEFHSFRRDRHHGR